MKIPGARRFFLEAGYHLVPLSYRHTTVEKDDFGRKGFLQVPMQHFPHLGKLREDERVITFRQNFLEHLGETGDLA